MINGLNQMGHRIRMAARSTRKRNDPADVVRSSGKMDHRSHWITNSPCFIANYNSPSRGRSTKGLCLGNGQVVIFISYNFCTWVSSFNKFSFPFFFFYGHSLIQGTLHLIKVFIIFFSIFIFLNAQGWIIKYKVDRWGIEH